MRFVDTNVLLYSVSVATADHEKRSRALALLRSVDLAVSVQVLQEFYVQATRASRRDPLTHAQARGLIDLWTRFPTQPMTVEILTDALDIRARHGFSYWDSAILAAALALGCDTLLTEDLSHGQRIDGLTISNPFL